LAAASQPIQPAALSGAAGSLLLIGPATVVPPGVVNVSVIEVNPSPCACGTTKCQPSLSEARFSNGPSHSFESNPAAVVGT
jgi:hypothetical protein